MLMPKPEKIERPLYYNMKMLQLPSAISKDEQDKCNDDYFAGKP
jgi:hypothetical protein